MNKQILNSTVLQNFAKKKPSFGLDTIGYSVNLPILPISNVNWAPIVYPSKYYEHYNK